MIKGSFRRGFTLLEVLIVVSLFTMISITLYSALANGIKVWERSRRLVIEEDVAIFFDKISQDIRNAYVYSKFGFSGNEHQFSFPSVVSIMTSRRGSPHKLEYVDQMGKVTYYYDMSEKVIYRAQADYGQAVREIRPSDTIQEIVRNIDSLSFEYVYLTEDEKIVSRDVLEVLPSGVIVEVGFQVNGQPKTLLKAIDIPLSG